ncbi:unnamed protein product [Brachionus calyciflorus]|uniref:C2H2-type domain-containing protein n=1 Tax=Brachionus calyciflorus TaxID=104777 RepID=A0A814AT98_9BILA|nr:unnamed protein product [Brachionus calyciflorus]
MAARIKCYFKDCKRSFNFREKFFEHVFEHKYEPNFNIQCPLCKTHPFHRYNAFENYLNSNHISIDINIREDVINRFNEINEI